MTSTFPVRNLFHRFRGALIPLSVYLFAAFALGAALPTTAFAQTTPVAAPTGVGAELNTAGDSIVITWTAGVAVDGVTAAATGYETCAVPGSPAAFNGGACINDRLRAPGDVTTDTIPAVPFTNYRVAVRGTSTASGTTQSAWVPVAGAINVPGDATMQTDDGGDPRLHTLTVHSGADASGAALTMTPAFDVTTRIPDGPQTFDATVAVGSDVSQVTIRYGVVSSATTLLSRDPDSSTMATVAANSASETVTITLSGARTRYQISTSAPDAFSSIHTHTITITRPPPSPPTRVVALGRQSTVDVSWVAPSTSTPAVTGYEYCYVEIATADVAFDAADCEGGVVAAVSATDAAAFETSITLTANRVFYWFAMRSFAGSGAAAVPSEWVASTRVATTNLIRPPVNVRVTPGDGGFTVAWDAPGDDVEGYLPMAANRGALICVLTADTGGGFPRMSDGCDIEETLSSTQAASLTHTFTNAALINGFPYRVAMRNSDGGAGTASAWTVAPGFHRPMGTYNVPTELRAFARVGEIHVEWDVSSGGTTPAHYDVCGIEGSSPSGSTTFPGSCDVSATVAGGTRSATFDSAAVSGAALIFGVRARNLDPAHTGTWLTLGNAVSTLTAPGTSDYDLPFNVRAVAGNDSVTVTWDVTDTGGADWTHFDVCGFTPGTAPPTMNIPVNCTPYASVREGVRTATLAVDNGTRVSFAMRTVDNDGGAGESAWVVATPDVVTPVYPASATLQRPTDVVGIAQVGQVNIEWRVPTTMPAPRAYQACLYQGSGAFNADRCVGAAVKAGNFDASDPTLGRAIFTGLENNLPYWGAVRGTHPDAADSPTAWVRAARTTTPMPLADVESGSVTATAVPGGVSVSWRATAGLASQWQACAIAATDTFVDGSDAVATCLARATTELGDTRTRSLMVEYNIAVPLKVAVRSTDSSNGVLLGWEEADGTVTPQVLPGAPTAVSATTASTMLEVRWTAPAETGEPALGSYEVCRVATASFTDADASCTGGNVVTSSGTDTMHTLTGLTDGTEYTLAVRARSTLGAGAWSATTTATPDDVQPTQPTDVVLQHADDEAVTTSNGFLTMKWMPPETTENQNGYHICVHALSETITAFDETQCDASSPITGTSGVGVFVSTDNTRMNHDRNNLTNGTRYTAAVRAIYNAPGENGLWTVATPSSIVVGDNEPNAFSFTEVTEVEPGAAGDSGKVVIAGINYAVPISFAISSAPSSFSIAEHVAFEVNDAAGTQGETRVPDSAELEIFVTVPECGQTAVVTVTIGAGDNNEADFSVSSRACRMDAALSALTVNDGTTTTALDLTATSQNVHVENSITSVTVSAASADDNADISFPATVSLNEGDNSFSVNVTAEDRTTRQSYTVTVHRTAPPSTVRAMMSADETTVEWDDPDPRGTVEDGYHGFDVCAYENMGGGFDETQCEANHATLLLANIDSGANLAYSYAPTNLVAGTNYYFAVRSLGVDGDDESGWTEATSTTAAALAAADSGAAISRAITSITNAAISGRIASLAAGGIGGFNVADDFAQTASNFLAAQGDALQEGGDMKTLLNGLDGKVIALSAALPAYNGGGAGLSVPAFWASGDYRDLSSDDDEIKWDGDVVSFQLGADARTAGGTLLGAAVSRSESDIDYNVETAEANGGGDQSIEMTSFHPYIGWRTGEADMWASLAYGAGELENTPDDGDVTTYDVDMTGGAFGASTRLGALRMHGEVEVARMTIKGIGEEDSDVDADAHRIRVGTEWASTTRNGAAATRRAVEFGARHDGGDGVTGLGAEIGFSLAYNNGHGMTLTTRARALAAHGKDYDEWGAGAMLHYAPGADGQGLAVRMAPSWGATASRTEALLDQGVNELDADAFDSSGTMDSEIAYGIAQSRGMITPYSGFALRTSGGRDYRIGTRYRLRLPTHASALEMGLEAYRHERDAADEENGVLLEARIRW